MESIVRNPLDADEKDENARKSLEAAQRAFPHERWESAASVEFRNKGRDFEVADGIEDIMVARSLLTQIKNDERTLSKEIRQAEILADRGIPFTFCQS